MTSESGAEHWVCLAGGNALGAFHVGAIEALLDAGVPVQRVAGASIGALMAALWLGGPRETAGARLRAFWQRAENPFIWAGFRHARQMAAMQAMLGGRPGVFAPTLPGFWAAHPVAPSDDHLHTTSPQRRTLCELIDFDRLNDGETRLIVTALDQETAEDVVFDSAEMRITVDHLMASSALPLIFPPVRVDGRLLVDPGLSANLPLAALFRDPPGQHTICWAIDLWPPAADRATSPDTVLRRAQELLFAAQGRHALERLSATLSSGLQDTGTTVTVHHLGYDGAEWETGLKGFDFSRAAILRRGKAGTRAMQKALAAPMAQEAGFHVIRHAFTG